MNGDGTGGAAAPASEGADGGRTVRWRRWGAGTVVVGEVTVLVCLVAGVRFPWPVVLAVEALVLTALTAGVVVTARRYRRARRAGEERGPALRRAVRQGVPPLARRLVAHEARAMVSLVLWAARRSHGVGPGARAVGYARCQAPMMFLLTLASVIETVVLALVVPWPVVHAVLLVLGLYGVLMMVGLHASCVTRPHVAGADGSLRVRYGALFDLRIPAGLIASVRYERRYTDGRLLRVGDAGDLDLIVDSQTSVTVELTAPVTAVRPFGKPVRARLIRFHADDPRAAVAALRSRGATEGERAAVTPARGAAAPERPPVPAPAGSPAPDSGSGSG
ncbi:hypothetical protein [Streptomyces xinghaiensis]|uniref:hypothetical protein n=1 Tax=Streptomyces xinghaiensis TaxID=1038928 RepID=UPI002E0DAEF0|nr:hypothetical protein OG463_06855 [Streptomyces xinghaiensis]